MLVMKKVINAIAPVSAGGARSTRIGQWFRVQGGGNVLPDGPPTLQAAAVAKIQQQKYSSKKCDNSNILVTKKVINAIARPSRLEGRGAHE